MSNETKQLQFIEQEGIKMLSLCATVKFFPKNNKELKKNKLPQQYSNKRETIQNYFTKTVF